MENLHECKKDVDLCILYVISILSLIGRNYIVSEIYMWQSFNSYEFNVSDMATKI